MLLKYEPLFDGSLGNWKTDLVHLQLRKCNFIYLPNQYAKVKNAVKGEEEV
jgi:hypothetical protein